MRARRFLIALTCLVACGEIDLPVNPLVHVVPVPAGQTAAATIGPAGGSVELGSTDGARFRLDVPAGALDSTWTIDITTYEASRRQRFLVRFAPAGLAFSVPATITVDLPAANAVAAAGTLTYNGAPVVMERMPGGSMRTPIRRFARSFANWVDLKGTQIDMPHSEPPGPPCSGGADNDMFVRGALVAADDVPYGLYGMCASANISTVWLTGDFSDAVRLADVTDAFFQRPAQVQTPIFVDDMRRLTCDLLQNIVSREPEPAWDSFGRLHSRLGRILFLVRHAQTVGGSCTAMSTYPTAVDGAVGAAASYYASREGAITSVGSLEYAQALQDARDGVDLADELTFLGASDEVVGHATRVVRDVAHPALIELLLPAAQGACSQNGNTAPLLQLIGIMGPRAELTAALDACGAAATVRRP